LERVEMSTLLEALASVRDLAALAFFLAGIGAITIYFGG
jgi:hypothetical protein